MINRAELERATQKYQQELTKATADLRTKTELLEKAEHEIPVMRREIVELQENLSKKKLALAEAERNVQKIKPEIPRLTMEMKRIHHELEQFTHSQAVALKETGVEGIRHKF